MSSKTLCLFGGQLLSLAVIGWLWSENRELRANPAAAGPEVGHLSSRQVASHQGAAAFSESANEGPAKSAKRRSPDQRERSAFGPVKSGLPWVEPADDGVVLRVPGSGRGFPMSTEDLATFDQQLRSARMDAVVRKPGGPSWSPGQAAGAPDTADHGDFRTAWASAAPDGGKEWLQLNYGESTEIGEVVVHESYNPGAISRIVALMPDGSETVLWEGTESTVAPGQALDSVFKAPPGIRSDQIRVELDTTRVQGWNEIDAVELVGTDGKRQWATESTASSYYGDGAQRLTTNSVHTGFLETSDAAVEDLKLRDYLGR